MKKQHITITIIILTAAIIIGVAVFLLTRPTIREWTGEDAAHNSLTTRGFFGIANYNGNAVITFADFTSERESVFCSLPQCRHNSRDCFAFDLFNTYSARHFAIMGQHIYFTSSSFDPLRENPNIIEIYEASFTGGTVRSIAIIENPSTIIIEESWMQDGYYILRLSGHASANFAVVDLRTGELWQIPSNLDSFITINNGRLYFRYGWKLYPVNSDDFLNEDGEIDWPGYNEAISNSRRFTVYVADFNTKTVQPWNEEFTQRQSAWSTFHSFADGILYSYSADPGTNSRFVNLLLDFDTGEVIRELDFGYGLVATALGNYALLLFEDDTTGHGIYCLGTDTYVITTELNQTIPGTNMRRFHYNLRSVGNLIFFIEATYYMEFNEEYTYFITVEDLLNNGIRNMRSVHHELVGNNSLHILS